MRLLVLKFVALQLAVKIMHGPCSSGEARPKRAARGSGLMPIPDLCILECVITGYYKLMNVIITRESMYSPSACV